MAKTVHFRDAELIFCVVVAETDLKHIFGGLTNCTRP